MAQGIVVQISYDALFPHLRDNGVLKSRGLNKKDLFKFGKL